MGMIFGLLGLGLLVGVPIGVIVALSRIAELRRSVESLERRTASLQRELARIGAATRGAAVPAQAPAETVPAPPPPAPAAVAPAPPLSAPAAVAPASPPLAQRAEPHPVDDWPARLLARARDWLFEGNVPVKVGMVVLFAGVAALLKYVADQGWMRFPIELRLAGIAAAAVAALLFALRQREQRRVFALSLQGGAIGVLLMTVFAAYRLYGLVNPSIALSGWVVLASAAAALAVWQEARALAVLGILAGFLAPVLMSTGSGNHVALFSFYAVLNAAVFGIAWSRPWRELNLLGFAFTFGIGTWWGVLHYTPEKLATTLPFLLLFFAFYLLLPVLHARKGQDARGHVVDGCLVFGTPLVAFAQLAALLEGDRYWLAGSAVALAALYAALAAWPMAARAPLLRQAHAVLAVGFATLAVPLALSAQATTSVFALEGAGLVWLGVAQSRTLARQAGAALQLLAALVLVTSIDAAPAVQAVANPVFMGMLLLSLAGLASAWCSHRADARGAALAWYLWGVAWWLVMGNREIGLHLAASPAVDARLGFAALTAALSALGFRIAGRAPLAWTTAAALTAAIALALWQDHLHVHPFAGTGLAAWIVHALLGGAALRALRAAPSQAAGTAQAAWLLAACLAIALWLHAAAQSAGLASGWRYAAFALPWLLAGAALQWRPGLATWPLQQRAGEWRGPLLVLWQLLLVGIALALLLVPGNAAPLPWVPLFNPVELALAGALVLVAAWWFGEHVPQRLRPQRPPVLAIALWLVLSSMTLRAVHHLGGAPWDSRLFDTALAQASLSLVWSVLGVAGWVAGSRRRQRELWLAGAVLMAVVLTKLVLVDRGHLGNLPGIASFIGYGLLCTLVGYLAPAPPRTAAR